GHRGRAVARHVAGGEDQMADGACLGSVRERLRGCRCDHPALHARTGDVPDQVDFYQSSRDQQAGRANCGARRWHRKIVAPDLVEGSEMVEVAQEDLGPHHLVKRTARGLEGLREIAQHILRLQLDVGAVIRKARPLARFWSYPGLVIAGDLACRKHPRADLEALVIVRQRARCTRSYGCDVHGLLLVCLGTMAWVGLGHHSVRSFACPSSRALGNWHRLRMASAATMTSRTHSHSSTSRW